MTDSDYSRSVWLFVVFLVVAGAILVARAMPVVHTKTVQVETKYVYKGSKEYDDVCQGYPGVVRKVEAKKGKGWTFFLLQPIEDNYSVPCQIEGYWPEFKEGMIISIPKGKVSG